MVHIKITKGLDIPIRGKPSGSVQEIILSGEASVHTHPSQIAFDFSSFDDVKFTLLVKLGDQVKIGQPLAEDRATPGRMFVSPAGGVIQEIRRGDKRVLLAIVIAVAKQEEMVTFPALDVGKASREDLIERLKEGGMFSQIRSRPFNRLADPEKMARSIFVKAIESAPFVPPAELQVSHKEKEFQLGLDVLAKLTTGLVHLVYAKESPCRAFTEARQVQKHTAEGPHPIGTHSLHIQSIDPISSAEVTIWTLTVLDVLAIGYLVGQGRFLQEKIIAIAGPAVLKDRIGYFRVRYGMPIKALVAGRIEKGPMRFISGDPLIGHTVSSEDFLGNDATVFSVIPEITEREFLHFMGISSRSYSFSRAYLSGHFDNSEKEYDFTTSLHGEHRAFVDSTLYDLVMPLSVPTMPLVKAVMAEDYELAEFLGLLEVDSEDFALSTFVCPSKMEMVSIIKQGLKVYANEIA